MGDPVENTITISATSSEQDQSIHIVWSWNAGEPRCGTAEGQGGNIKTGASTGKIPRPAAATVLTYQILFDKKNSSGQEVFTWGVAGTKVYP